MTLQAAVEFIELVIQLVSIFAQMYEYLYRYVCLWCCISDLNACMRAACFVISCEICEKLPMSQHEVSQLRVWNGTFCCCRSKIFKCAPICTFHFPYVPNMTQKYEVCTSQHEYSKLPVGRVRKLSAFCTIKESRISISRPSFSPCGSKVGFQISDKANTTTRT